MLDRTAKFWKESGLCEGLNDEQANEVSGCLEKTAKYLLSLGKKHIPFISTAIFPVLVRLYIAINKPGKFFLIVNNVDLYWDLNEKWEEFGKSHSELFNDPKIDVEAEFVVEYCMNYIVDLKKRGII